MISKSRSTRHPLNGCMGALERPIGSDQFYVLLFLRQKQVDVLNDKDGIHWAQGVYVWLWPTVVGRDTVAKGPMPSFGIKRT